MQEHTDHGSIHIRVAAIEDAKELLKIYAPYVTETAISFEYEVPSSDEFRMRIAGILQKYPYILAEQGGEILGYAYTRAFVGRAAYDWSVETTVYLKKGKTKMGVGRKLYEALERISKAQNILNLNACIADPEVEDEYLTMNSVQFHEHLGYRMVGIFHNSGYKFDTWYHMVWMEKIIGEHTSSPLPVIPFPELDPEEISHLLHFST